MMKGYWNNEKATKDTLDSDGFLHTGDIGYIDERGHLFIVDRLKELIKVRALVTISVQHFLTLISTSTMDSKCLLQSLKLYW